MNLSGRRWPGTPGAILDANDAIWGYAELAFHETKSAALLEKLLEENGFTVQTGLAGIPTCFTGTYVKGSGKPVMGVLGEFDALSSLSQQAATPEKIPVQEGAPGHGCGHCALGTGALAAAFAIKDYLTPPVRTAPSSTSAALPRRAPAASSSWPGRGCLTMWTSSTPGTPPR